MLQLKVFITGGLKTAQIFLTPIGQILLRVTFDQDELVSMATEMGTKRNLSRCKGVL